MEKSASRRRWPALAAQEGLDGIAWELLLVDNNCTDRDRRSIRGH